MQLCGRAHCRATRQISRDERNWTNLQNALQEAIRYTFIKFCILSSSLCDRHKGLICLWISSHWKFLSLHWNGLCYCVQWLEREFWNFVGMWSLVYVSTSLYTVTPWLTKPHGVTCYKTVTYTVTLCSSLGYTTLNVFECTFKLNSTKT